jgi:hypothetical protein
MCKVESRCGIPCVAVAVIAACALSAAGCGKVAAQGSPDAAQPADAPAPDAALTWSPFTQVAVNYAGSTRVPVPSGDGLTLYFLADVSSMTDVFDLYSASRASTADGFGVATALLNVNVAGEDARYPDVSEDGLELYYSKGDGGPIMVATRSNTSSAFAAPAPVATGIAGNFPSISGNKLALYYIAVQQGKIDGTVMRTTRAAVGEAWSAPAPVTVTGAIQIYSAIDISSDELALLRAPTLSPLGHNVLISRRASKTAAFDQTEVAQAIDLSGVAIAGARWSAHDTEIWIGNGVGQLEKPFVSRLR